MLTAQEQLEILQQQLQQLENSFCCPITLQIMAEPCIAADGHTYEKEAIEKIINSGDGISPMTGERITNPALIANHTITSAISKYLESRQHLYNQDKVYLPNGWLKQLVKSISSNKRDRVKRLLSRDLRLLDYSFSPEITNLQQPYTTLQLACEKGSPDLITDLFKLLHARDKLDTLAEPPAGFNPEPLNELLQQALEKAEAPEFLALLLKAGAIVEEQDPIFGNTLLHDFATQGNLDAVDWLLQHGACLERPNDRGNTALLLAVTNGHAKLTTFLLEQYANPQVKNADQQSAVLLAFMHNHPQIVPLLIGPETTKLPPLHLALKLDDHELFKFLLAQPNVDLTAVYGAQQLTPLHFAVMRGNLAMVQLLLAAQATINALSINNDTALHLAAITGKDDIITLLVRSGANHKIRNSQNQTPAEAARSKHKHKTAAVIEQEVMALKRADASKVTELLAKVTQLQTTVIALDGRERAHNARNVEAFMIQFKKSTPQPVNKEKLTSFLKCVVNGEQEQARTMLRDNPALALVAGDVTDHAGRTFKGITGLQAAVWALDWEMWSMIENYLPAEAARLQAEKFSSGSWVKDPNIGEYFNITQLLATMRTYIDIYSERDDQECEEYWIKVVGKEQRKLPMHMLQYYCDQTRAFDPIPKFDDLSMALTRKMDINLSKLGTEFGIARGNHQQWVKDAKMALFVPKHLARSKSEEGWWFDANPCVYKDCDALEALFCTRVQQRKQLVNTLMTKMQRRPTLQIA